MTGIVAVLGSMLLISPAVAQQAAGAGAQQQATVQMQCRTLAANETAKSGEALVNGMACHAVSSESTANATAQNSTPNQPNQSAQPDQPAQPPTAPAQSGAAAPAGVPAEGPLNDGKTRVFVTDSQSWEEHGGSSAGGNRHGWGSSSWMSGGARPQTAEIIKTLNQRCPEIIVTDNQARANFVLTLDHEGGKSALARNNKIAVFNRDGDDVFSTSTRSLGNAVKDACKVMLAAQK